MPQQKRGRMRDRDSRIRRLIVLGIALIVVGACAVVIVPRAVQQPPSPTAAPVQFASPAPTSVPTSAPTSVPTAAPVQTTAPAATRQVMSGPTPLPTPEAALSTINTVDQGAELVAWMIETNTKKVKLDAMNLSGDQLEAVMDRFGGIDRWSYNSVSLELTLRIGARIVAALKNGDEARLSAEEQDILRKARQVVAAEISPGMSDYEKELALHDYIIYNCNYDINQSLNTPDARGFFNHGYVQCCGYSDVFKLLGYLSGLEVRSVTGDVIKAPDEDVGETNGHEWNLILLDGQWYAVDVTWDDPRGGGKERHSYLNVPHRIFDGERTYDPEALPDGAFAQSYDHNYYYVRKGVAASTPAEAKQLLRSQLVSNGRAELCYLSGELDVQAMVKEIRSELGARWGFNTSWRSGPTGVTSYEITIN